MSFQKPVKRPSSAFGTGLPQDLHLHINLCVGTDELTASRAAPDAAPTATQLWDIASYIYGARRTRDKLLDKQLFGEPAWDILLALYCLSKKGERLSVTSLSLAAELPQTTGHRWQTILEERGLVKRGGDKTDRRRQFVTLTEEGRRLLESYLTSLFYAETRMPSRAVDCS